ncbi:MAG TPA: arylsulfatase [Candidatus Latescibacteria bacterium]|jgi:arylsulfatase A-like enzyme|nr:arylsulfatase [Candidatus Latescibacterota bacterium]|tara:strand:- start:111 stop:1532 length:1422 start_codon:yes stop_codon:yes gene_type:complete
MASSRPNLLLILTDHWRGDSLGRLGHPVADTPHLDSLSAAGTTFTSAYTPCPSCIAARRSLMTGMTPYSQGMVGYQDGKPWEYDNTLAGTLRDGGYQTVNIGKTHFHPARAHLGFELLKTSADYSAWLQQQQGLSGIERFAHGVPGNSWLGRPNHLPEHQMEETWFVTEALDFLRHRDPTRPFMLCLSFNGPHPPWCPPQVYYDQFIDRHLPAPEIGDWAAHHADDATYPMDINQWRGRVPEHVMHRARAAYFAYLAFLDAQIGRLIETMNRSGDLGETLTLFTSDHGEMLGDHHLWRKTYAYEASARIPFILCPPASFQGARNVEVGAPVTVGWEDIMPTLLETAGVAIPESVEGRSILPLMQGETNGWREFYHGEHSPCYHPENANQYLTDGHWKYIWNPITGEEQLFHLDEDPHECRDLASTDGTELNHWRSRMVAELQDRQENLSDGTRLTPSQVPAWRFGSADELHLG